MGAILDLGVQPFKVERMNLRRRQLNSSGTVYTGRVRINLLNFCDPFYNTMPVERPFMEAALNDLIHAGEVTTDGTGGWKLKSRENPTFKYERNNQNLRQNLRRRRP